MKVTKGQLKDVKITEDWKKAQNQPQFLNPDKRCLNCAGNHRTCDCLIRQQHQVPNINNPVNGQSTHNYSPPYFTQQSPQQQLQQIQSTAGSSTPMLMVNNPQYRQSFQGQPQRQPTPLVPHVPQQVRPPTPQTVNQQYNQYQVPQASPLLAQPQYNPQIPPPYPGQWHQQALSVQSNPSDNNSNVSQILQEQQEYFKFMREKEEAHKQYKHWKEE